MSACYQTTDVKLGNAPGYSVAYLQRPIMPFSARAKFAEGYSVKLTRPDGTVITWFVNGFTQIEAHNGDYMSFYAKPSIADAVHSDESNTFYQFHADGYIDYRGDNCFYTWSKDYPGVEENGEIFFDHKCGSDIVWDDECAGHCDHYCRSRDRSCSRRRCERYGY